MNTFDRYSLLRNFEKNEKNVKIHDQNFNAQKYLWMSFHANTFSKKIFPFQNFLDIIISVVIIFNLKAVFKF